VIESSRFLNEGPELCRHLSIFDRVERSLVASVSMRARSPTTLSVPACIPFSSLLLNIVLGSSECAELATISIDDNIKDVFPQS